MGWVAMTGIAVDHIRTRARSGVAAAARRLNSVTATARVVSKIVPVARRTCMGWCQPITKKE
jgi:hypothetical protein